MKNTFIIFLCFLIFSSSNGQELRNHFSYDKKENFDEQTYLLRARDSQKRIEKTIINGYDTKIPFYHYINLKNKNKFVIILHGLGGSKDNWVQREAGMSLIDSLVVLGYNVILPDAKFHGERSYELNFRPAATLPPARSKSIKDAKSLFEVYSSTTKDVRIIMDYLENKYSDEKLQFNLMGYSMGGAISLIVNSVDSRVNSVVACVPPVNRPISELKDFDWPSDITELMKDMTPTFYSAYQKSPVALLMGRTDYFTSEDEATQFYKKIPNTDKQLKFYEAGHGLPGEYINDVIEWITAHNKK